MSEVNGNQIKKEDGSETLYVDSLDFELSHVLRAEYDPEFEFITLEYRTMKFPGKLASVSSKHPFNDKFWGIRHKFSQLTTYLLAIKDAILGRDNNYAVFTILTGDSAQQLGAFLCEKSQKIKNEEKKRFES